MPDFNNEELERLQEDADAMAEANDEYDPYFADPDEEFEDDLDDDFDDDDLDEDEDDDLEDEDEDDEE